MVLPSDTYHQQSRCAIFRAGRDIESQKKMNASQLKTYVIRPTLQRLDLWSESAEKLLLGTIAHESAGGEYLHQIGGPALGIYQIEPPTHQDVWENFLRYRSGLMLKIQDLIPPGHRKRTHGGWVCGSDSLLITDLTYATAIARVIYLRAPLRLPEPDDMQGLADYWKKYYNTPLGKGTTEKWLADYATHVGES